jgi:NAD(P)-dependent dehydrogenase (short-subunit alcohol dehydrogenase family)
MSKRRLEGRVALVTGASSGLGRRFAHVLAREGACVALLARRRDRLEDTLASVEAAGGRALALACDVTSEVQVQEAFDRTQERFGLVDTVVNNAGMNAEGGPLDQTREAFASVLDVNVTSVFIVAREAARRLIAEGPEASSRGRIVNIASIGARKALSGVPAYCASKAAVVMLTRSLAREWGRHRLNVNSISPGYIATEINTDWLNSPPGQKMIAGTTRRRIMAEDSLDEALLFLTSDGSGFVTGTDVVVDDGQTL